VAGEHDGGERERKMWEVHGEGGWRIDGLGAAPVVGVFRGEGEREVVAVPGRLGFGFRVWRW
jgi:hypothetical protein